MGEARRKDSKLVMPDGVSVEEQAEPSQPMITITLAKDPKTGTMQISGPLQDPGTFLGMLEEAKMLFMKRFIEGSIGMGDRQVKTLDELGVNPARNLRVRR
jgi:hypothetical protein